MQIDVRRQQSIDRWIKKNTDQLENISKWCQSSSFGKYNGHTGFCTARRALAHLIFFCRVTIGMTRWCTNGGGHGAEKSERVACYHGPHLSNYQKTRNTLNIVCPLSTHVPARITGITRALERTPAPGSFSFHDSGFEEPSIAVVDVLLPMAPI